MNGTGSDTFSPDMTMTRGILVSVLYRYEGEPAVTASNPLSDVAAGKYYEEAVIWVAENSIVGGYDAASFGQEDDITREQVATILMRYAKWKGLDVTKTAELTAYVDVNQISDWALSAMEWTNAEGLLTGRTKTTLSPKSSITQAEVATLLMRFIEKLEE